MGSKHPGRPDRRGPRFMTMCVAMGAIVIGGLLAGLLAARASQAAVAMAAPAPATGTALGPVPLAEPIAEPYTNDKCLDKCHGLPHYRAGGADGALRDVSVDAAAFAASTHGQKGLWCIDCHQGADPNGHPRSGYPDVDCRACHAKQPPAGVFPADALVNLSEKGIAPPPQESLKGDGWLTTQHGQAWQRGGPLSMPAAPHCADCHSAHGVQKSSVATSRVHRDNLAATCGSCHPDQVTAGGVGGALARFRLGGHGKGDLSEKHAATQCLSCHQGQAAHGEDTVTGQRCPTCHQADSEAAGGASATAARFHIKPLSADQPAARALRTLYTAGFWGAVAVLALGVTLLGFSQLYRREEDG